MAWLTFNTLAAGNQALSLFDTQFANVAQWGLVDCTAAGTNAVTLTASLANYTAPVAANFASYRFAAAATSTASVTLKGPSQAGFLNAYRGDGTTQCGANDLIANQVYVATFNQALNGNAGGWYISLLGTPGNFPIGFTVTPNNLGTIAGGTVTPNAINGNYQYYTNNAAHTLAAPAADSAIDLLVTNGAAAGAITFSGFTVGSNVGSSLTTTNTNKFLISIRRINAIATYSVYALQ